MNTPTVVILGIAALLGIMYFFGSGPGSADAGRHVRFSDQLEYGGSSCSGNTCAK